MFSIVWKYLHYIFDIKYYTIHCMMTKWQDDPVNKWSTI